MKPSLRCPPRKSEIEELQEELADALEQVSSYQRMLEDVFHSGAFTVEELGKIRYVAECYGAWIP